MGGVLREFTKDPYRSWLVIKQDEEKGGQETEIGAVHEFSRREFTAFVYGRKDSIDGSPFSTINDAYAAVLKAHEERAR